MWKNGFSSIRALAHTVEKVSKYEAKDKQLAEKKCNLHRMASKYSGYSNLIT
jgi:hypothetical protein